MVTLESNVDTFVERFSRLAEKARYQLATQILADANKHVRADSWELKRSSERASVPAKGELVWDTPYAKKVYYTGVPSHDENPDAELMWVQVARDRYSDDWLVVFKNLAEQEVLK